MNTNRLLIITAAVIGLLLVGVLIGQAVARNNQAAYVSPITNQDSNDEIDGEEKEEKPVVKKPTALEEKIMVLKTIFAKHMPVGIYECADNGQNYFSARIEPTGDAGSAIYSSTGDYLGNCGAFRPNNASNDGIFCISMAQCTKVYHAPNFGPASLETNIYNLK